MVVPFDIFIHNSLDVQCLCLFSQLHCVAWNFLCLCPDIPRKSSVEERPGEKTDLVQPGDLQQRSPQSAETTPRRLQKQIDRAIGNHHTSAGMINAVVGPTGLDTRRRFYVEKKILPFYLSIYLE